MKRFAALITTAALLGAPHSASAAGLNLSALPIGSLVPTVLNVALPVVTDLAPTLSNLHLPLGTLVPTVLNIALPIVDGAAPVLAPLPDLRQLVWEVPGIRLNFSREDHAAMLDPPDIDDHGHQCKR